MKKQSSRNLEQAILKILDENSGGVTMLKLIVELLVQGFKEDTDHILAVVEKSKDMKYLSYTWKSQKREKYFIYTP